MKTEKLTLFLKNTDSSLEWNHRIIIPKNVAENFLENNDRRVVCTINNNIIIHAALMPADGDYFIMINKSIRKKLSISEGSALQIELEKDTSKYGMEMPNEFQEMLDQESDAFDYFSKLTPGKQRTLIHLVGKVKNTDSRVRKSLAITEHLKESKGEIDFKKLNEKIKYYNNL